MIYVLTGGMTLGERLRGALKARDMSQSELARRLGLKHQAVNQWAGDRGRPSLKRLEEIADVLGVSVAELLGDADAAPEGRPGVITPGARFEAVREIIWRRHGGIRQAARDMRVPQAKLEAIRSGTAQPTRDEIVLLCGWADCPRAFIEQGRLEGMRAELAWHLGHSAPHLVPHLSGGEASGGGGTPPASG